MAIATSGYGGTGTGGAAGSGSGPEAGHEPGRRGRGRGLLAPVSARTWGGLLYLLVGLPTAALMCVFTVVFLALGLGLSVIFVGLPVLAATLAGVRGLGHVERARARALLGARVVDPTPPRPKREGLMSWVGAQLGSGMHWRHVLYMELNLVWTPIALALSLALTAAGWGLLLYPAYRWVFPRWLEQPGMQLWGDDATGRAVYVEQPWEVAGVAVLGLLLVYAAAGVVRGTTAVSRLMVEGMLAPSSLSERVRTLESTRGAAVDTAASDLRRIERDLHDGAQARLVALAMGLGLAKERLEEEPEMAAEMVEEAHGEVKLALQELRDLARGIHPAVLTDRGLDAALSSVASRCTVPVRMEVRLPPAVGEGADRPDASVESIAYFVVSELLTNASKHSGARSVGVEVWEQGRRGRRGRGRGRRLMLRVRDDGAGGAVVRPGGGLAGLADRVRAVDGVFEVDSPVGGPTVVSVELPWSR
ncbi:sensor histidine kinase [Allostreptomyces psammosilenae]|uniref:histidine kinase n=1 Tax=Allostreptomyces psammosilenae TaxID=1892865 RepID=A0A852ZYR9_9ACTN|nr:sensor histidine kinase [Allostreptomyces psammosilenae]NYI05864.1 signal transduction histidine kinase [Allostreptomyces psammosilenae]